jgi:hypothetical protein
MSDAHAQLFDDSPRAVRIRFVEAAPPDANVLRAFCHPAVRWAIGEPADLEQVLAADLPGLPQHDAFTLVFLPSGADSPIELQRRAESWVNDPRLPAEYPAIDLVVQSDRIVWRPGRALLIGSPRRVGELSAGLAEFSFFEAELRRLERELDADWPTAEADVSLTHIVDRRAMARRVHVDEMTRRTALRRIRLARLTPLLEKTPLTLSGPMRRLFSELAQQADAVDRLRAADDRLEVFEDLYELANDRLGEFGYFQRGQRLEAWILGVLVIEVLLMVFELWWAWWLA